MACMDASCSHKKMTPSRAPHGLCHLGHPTVAAPFRPNIMRLPCTLLTPSNRVPCPDRPHHPPKPLPHPRRPRCQRAALVHVPGVGARRARQLAVVREEPEVLDARPRGGLKEGPAFGGELGGEGSEVGVEGGDAGVCANERCCSELLFRKFLNDHADPCPACCTRPPAPARPHARSSMPGCRGRAWRSPRARLPHLRTGISTLCPFPKRTPTHHPYHHSHSPSIGSLNGPTHASQPASLPASRAARYASLALSTGTAASGRYSEGRLGKAVSSQSVRAKLPCR